MKNDRKLIALAFLVGSLMSLNAIAASGDCLVSDADWSSSGGGCKHTATGLVWSASTNQQNYNLAGATTFCQNLTQQGVSGWRVPTKDELVTAFGAGAATHVDTNLAPYSYAMHWSNTKEKGKFYGVSVVAALKLINKESQIAVICVK